MGTYRRILAAVDLTDQGARVAARAQALAAANPGATLSLLHVVEYVPVEPLSDTLLPNTQLEAELVANARKWMAQLAGSLSPPPPWEVATGSIKAGIVRAARAGGYDLIVIGSHERHGLSVLVNLTEDTVLHAAPCDVLAVRLAPADRSA
jgi:universal stress protein A